MRTDGVFRAALRAFLVVSAALRSGAVHAHARGFHKHDAVTVTAGEVQVLAVLTVDEGHRCEVLRGAADADRDGKLDGAEVVRLKERLLRLATQDLRVRIGGERLDLQQVEVKLNLKEDFSTGATGVGMAVFLRSRLAARPPPGLKLRVEDASPDHSHLRVAVHQQTSVDGGATVQTTELERASPARVEVVLGVLDDLPTE